LSDFPTPQISTEGEGMLAQSHLEGEYGDAVENYVKQLIGYLYSLRDKYERLSREKKTRYDTASGGPRSDINEAIIKLENQGWLNYQDQYIPKQLVNTLNEVRSVAKRITGLVESMEHIEAPK